jgi:hypothetical protein
MAVPTVIVGRTLVSIVTLSPSANATATPLAFVQFTVDLSHVALAEPVQTRSPADNPAHSTAAHAAITYFCFPTRVSFAIELTPFCLAKTRLFYHILGKEIPKNDFSVFGISVPMDADSL